MLFIRKKSKTIFSLLLVTAFVLLIMFYVLPIINIANEEDFTYGIVTDVIDGDTYEVKIDNRIERVRLIGIDTPERYENNKLYSDAERTKRDINTIKKLGQLASEYAENIVKGKKVKLVKDKGTQDRDKYGRLLRYLYLEDGTFVNLRLVKDGYANVYTKSFFLKIDDFLAAERHARENKLGLWSDSLSRFY